ncbi:hypothetical protein [Lentzea aerocolonigenes]|uniref:hypothetical protein n=1 Tax=Lentzea aerocolonigenes TaxID=68170 RepID=UPI00069790E5|nr:hypothetical protein [Lentzea aerocolonigenes]
MFLLEPARLDELSNTVDLALLQLKQATAERLAEHVSAPVEAVRCALAELVTATLVYQFGRTENGPFIPIAAEGALNALIQRRRGELAAMQVEVAKLVAGLHREAGHSAGAGVELVEGTEAAVAAFAGVQLNARTEVAGVLSPPFPHDRSIPNPIELAQLAAGVSYRCVYSLAGMSWQEAVDDVRHLIAAGSRRGFSRTPRRRW